MLLRRSFDFAVVQQFLDHVLHDASAFLDVSHFTTAKQHGHLDLVLVFEKVLRLLHLETNVVIARLGTKANLLGLGVMSNLARLLHFLVLVLAIIHDSTNRRSIVGSHFHQNQF